MTGFLARYPAVPAGGGIFASTRKVGQYSQVVHAQTGGRTTSVRAGIVNGVNNNVEVLPAGYSLVYILLLVNRTGLDVGVIQPPGSAPVNLLIARLPNRALLIER